MSTKKNPRSRKQPDPAKAAGQLMISALENHQTLAAGWLTRSRLLELIPTLSPEIAQAALDKTPAKTRIIATHPADPDSMLVLKESLESVSQDEAFLKVLVQQGCSADTPVRPLTELTQPLDKTLKKLIDGYWTQHVERLPTGLSAMSLDIGKKKKLFAIHDERFTLPQVELSRQLVASLRSIKEHSQQTYPINWKALVQSVGRSDDDPLVRRAIVCEPFISQARAISANAIPWIALTEDVDTVIRSESLLQLLVQSVCQIEKPEVKLSTLTKLLAKDLQSQFADHWLNQVEQTQELDFATVQPAGTAKKRDVLIRDRRFPPPELALAENLVKILVSQKAIGGQSYPTTWQRLVELSGTPKTAVVDKATRTEQFQSKVVRSFSSDPDAPVSLTGDEQLLLDSPKLIMTALKKARSSDNHLIAVDKLTTLKSLHPNLISLFAASIERRLAEKTLPDGVGALKAGKKWSLFLISDAIGIHPSTEILPKSTNSSAVPASWETNDHPPVADPAHFARDFDEAFTKLDGKLGLPHYASLVDLRPALKKYSRDLFDEELLKLRREGRYALSLVEGRFGLSEIEQAACLLIDHVPHLLVQKRQLS